MKKQIWLILFAGLLCFWLVSCTTGGKNPAISGTAQDSAPEITSGDPDPGLPDSKTPVDLLLFMGGTNMAGRGNAADSTPGTEGHAFEFRAISDPTRLYPMTADFGKAENKPYGIDDGALKTGSMVPAFCEAYYEKTNTPVIAVSASEGGTTVGDWSAGNGRVEDAAERLSIAVSWIRQSDEYEVRHIYMVWCQGDADAEAGTDANTYRSRTEAVFKAMSRRGVEKCFLIQTGAGVTKPAQYLAIRETQTNLCRNNRSFVMVSALFSELNGMRTEAGGYTQQAYNLVGADAGMWAASYVLDPKHYSFTGGSSEPAEENQYNGSGIELPVDTWRHG